ncbi:CinA family protein [Agrococcus jejuensis]|uniref:Nicotinamide-nucleotide amidase n=1 Tax=Agrococcus jejuensis TaxID=399736 RepID=A0A1G8ANM0_9MICO|nr:nicotinamide-nucleotide amidohydrolase family protein [Agrococcus jejuensis]SDH22336.1 nicotinamide-nucleotide amidase [Agrococcus jejuensis]
MTAADVVRLAREAGATIAVAESLTGGALASAIVDVPGASAVLRLGVVAYDTAMKAAVLGVDAELLAQRGAVDGDVAAQMAAGARLLADVAGPATVGVATTGVAGPEPQDGHAVGEVHVGVATAAGARSIRLDLAGDRAAIRAATVAAALDALVAELAAHPPTITAHP